MSSLIKTVLGKKEETGKNGAAENRPQASILHVTDETFEEMVLKAPVPVLLDFWAPWCGPCRMVAPIVEELAHNYGERLVVAKINTDENGQIARQYGILGIPTLIMFKEGEEVDRVVGLAPRPSLEKRLDNLLAEG